MSAMAMTPQNNSLKATSRIVFAEELGLMIRAKESNLLNNYIAAKAKLDAAQEVVENMKPEVISVLTNLQRSKHIEHTLVVNGEFEFQLKTRNTYAFSAETERLAARLKELQAAEIKNGTAKVKTATPYVALAVTDLGNK